MLPRICLLLGLLGFISVACGAQTPSPTSAPTQDIIATMPPTVESAPIPVLETSTPTVDLAPTPAPISTPPPSTQEVREFMLDLVNAIRADENLVPLTVGINLAAQDHAEASLAGGYRGHWGLDGLNSGMRYTLAGGEQRNQENVFRSTCRGPCATDPLSAVREALDSWMGSPGHRKELLDSKHTLVNIGLAWGRNRSIGDFVFHAVLQFEGDYVTFSQPPTIGTDGWLSMGGRLRNGAALTEDSDLSIQVYYEPVSKSVTLGQLQRVYGVGKSLYVAKLRPPVSEGRVYTTKTSTVVNEYRATPHDIPANSPSTSDWDVLREWKDAARLVPDTKVNSTRHRITAKRWETGSAEFDVSASFQDVLEEYGTGVYKVVLRAPLDGEDEIVSEYHVFWDGE